VFVFVFVFVFELRLSRDFCQNLAPILTSFIIESSKIIKIFVACGLVQNWIVNKATI